MRASIFTILVDGVAATATKRATEEVNVAADGDAPPVYILCNFFFWVPFMFCALIYIYIYLYCFSF